ncbi:hypothetical protein IR083_01645 [Dysgonomonas sp. GY75]|uniref:hypothetical protein n=1 Tax=Dysgonomonas sp. GY75 TaxID=2780419 RepID=UPI001884053F|nr:hypothetical protein [Dysgonomonas sp. GY75]MBF0647519.1 hypothetical protein [Dysgonomonas sp. GY75]
MVNRKEFIVPIKIDGVEQAIKDTGKVKDSINEMQDAYNKFQENQAKIIAINNEFVDSLRNVGEVQAKANDINRLELIKTVNTLLEMDKQTKETIKDLNKQSDNLRSKFVENFQLFGKLTKAVEVIGEKIFPALDTFHLWTKGFYKTASAIGETVPEITSALTGKKFYNEDHRKEDDKLEAERRKSEMNKMSEFEKSLAFLVLATQESIADVQEAQRKAIAQSLDDFGEQKASIFYPVQGIKEGKSTTDDIRISKAHKADVNKLYNDQTNKILEDIRGELNDLLQKADNPQDAELIKKYLGQLIPLKYHGENEDSYWEEKARRIAQGTADGIVDVIADKIESKFESAAPVVVKTVTGVSEVIQDYAENYTPPQEELNSLPKEQIQPQSKNNPSPTQPQLENNQGSSQDEMPVLYFNKESGTGKRISGKFQDINSNLGDSKEDNIRQQREQSNLQLDEQAFFHERSLLETESFNDRQNELLDEAQQSMSNFVQANQEAGDAIVETAADTQESHKEHWSKISATMQEHVDIIMTGVNAIFSASNALLSEQLEEANEKFEAISEKYSEAVELRQESSDKISSLEEQSKNARGGRLLILQEQINQEMAKNQQLAQQEKQLAKEKEKAEKEKEKKEKQIKKNEISQGIIQGVANTALGVTKAWSLGPIIGPIMAAIVGAAGAIQVGVMTKQLSKLEDGGFLKGKRHSQGGMRIEGTNIEVEGGEYVINRESTSKNLGLVRYINSQRKELNATDMTGFFAKASQGFELPFQREFAAGGLMPAIETPSTIDNEALIDAIKSIKINSRVAVTDIIRAQEDAVQVDRWSGN